jgi:hypothetical protein
MSYGPKPILNVDIPKPQLHPAIIEATHGHIYQTMFGPTRRPSIRQRALFFPSYGAMLNRMHAHRMFYEYRWN